MGGAEMPANMHLWVEGGQGRDLLSVGRVRARQDEKEPVPVTFKSTVEVEVLEGWMRSVRWRERGRQGSEREEVGVEVVLARREVTYRSLAWFEPYPSHVVTNTSWWTSFPPNVLRWTSINPLPVPRY